MITGQEHKADLARLAPEPARVKAETASLAGGKSSLSSLHHTQLSALQQAHQPDLRACFSEECC